MGFQGTTTGVQSGEFISDCYGSKTETAGTVITRVIPPRRGKFAKVSSFKYSAGATAHTLTVLQCMEAVSASSEALSGQAVINLSKTPIADDGSAIAANDFLIIKHEDGSYGVYQVSSVSGLAITLTANLSKRVLDNSPVYFMGAPADHADRQFTMDASVVRDFADNAVGLGTSRGTNTPLLVHSNNATNAGTILYVSYAYVNLADI